MEANLHQRISQCATETYKQIKHKTLLISDIYRNFHSKTALYLHFLGKKKIKINIYICHNSVISNNKTVFLVISLIWRYPLSFSESMRVLL